MTTSERTYNQIQGELKRAQYVWEMARYKKRIHADTKARMQRQFHEAVADFAGYLRDHGYLEVVQ